MAETKDVKEPKESEESRKGKEFKGIVRIASKDIKGALPLPRALQQIKGIGFSLAENIADVAVKEMDIDRMEKIGNLNAKQIKQLEEIIMNPKEHGIPGWMIDRQKEPSTGKSGHLVVSDLDFQKKKDIEFQKDIRSYRGVRHMFGLRVRGQKTQTTGRKGTTLGVIRKKAMPKKTGKKEPKAEKGKKK